MNTWIYLIRDNDSKLIKIGYTSNPTDRFRQLTRQPTLLPNPHNFQVIDVFNGTQKEENKLHHFYAKYRTRGEWFDLVFCDLMDISYCFEFRSRYFLAIWNEDQSKADNLLKPDWSMLKPEVWRNPKTWESIEEQYNYLPIS